MSISVITPHYNDLNGVLKVYKCLLGQTQNSWQWIIVDDLSDINIRNEIQRWFQVIDDNRVQLICNAQKSNASVCRNLGVDIALYENLVFLDADDYIAPNFIANRQIEFIDFAVFGNYYIRDEKGKEEIKRLDVDINFLNKFLAAQFLWQTTCILWNRDFFNVIGQFHPQLPRLQDVELAIRALQNSTNYIVLDNTVDFYYNVIPIRSRNNFVKPVCNAVALFISELLDTSALNKNQKKMLSGYYYWCTKYLERSECFDDVAYVKKNLNMFYKKKYIDTVDYVFGALSLKLYTNRLLSGKTFLRLNRYLFKP